MYCPNCGAEKQERGQYCKECGKKVKGAKVSRSTLIISLLSLLIALAGTGAGLFFFLNKSEPIDQVKAEPQAAPAVQEEEKKPEKEEVKEEPKEEAVQTFTPEEPENNAASKTDIIKGAQDRVFTIFAGISQGSGFLFSDKGDVVTNAHVVAGFTEVIVRGSDGTEYQGKVIGISDTVDIALIRVESLAGKNPLPIEMAQTAVGTEVIALGSPRGLENTASIGFLTGVDRDIMGEFHYEKVYQIDAQIAPGSSGGPLLDGTTGKVIGINSAVLMEDESIGFSIPMFSVYDQFSAWSQIPMNEDEVRAVFGVYEEYSDYWLWEDEDWEFNEDDYFDYESEDGNSEDTEYEEEAPVTEEPADSSESVEPEEPEQNVEDDSDAEQIEEESPEEDPSLEEEEESSSEEYWEYYDSRGEEDAYLEEEGAVGEY